jgi:hypothetical protein
MIKRTFIVFAIVSAIIFSGCKKNFNDQPEYIGIWKNGNGAALTLSTNNTYTLTELSVLVSSGKYSATKSVFSLVGTAGFCHDSLAATYTYTYSVTDSSGTFIRNLMLVADADSCTARSAIMPGNYVLPNK